MFFALSKILWGLVQPLSAVLLLVVLGMVLAAFGRRRLGLVASGLAVLVLVLTSFTTLGAWMIGPLEDRFVRPATMPAEVGAILLLGGGSDGRIGAARDLGELNAAGDRLAETLRLAQLYPQAKVIVSGGVGTLDAEGETDAATAARFFAGFGIGGDRLVLEGQSRNTAESADLASGLLGETAGAIVMVTSAFHMPRSVGLFRKAGVAVVPWPVDYRSTGREGLALELGNPLENLTTASTALREWIGLLAYRWTGRIDEVRPGPQASN